MLAHVRKTTSAMESNLEPKSETDFVFLATKPSSISLKPQTTYRM